MSESDAIAIELFRDYLLIIARSLVTPKIKAKLDASDLVQQTMLDAHNKLDQFRGTSDQHLGAWLRQILKNNFLNSLRALHANRRDIRRELPLDLEQLVFDSFSRVEQWLASNDPSPSQLVADQEQVLRLPSALNELTEDQREAIILYHIQGLKLAEVAERMNKSESAIGGLLYRGLRDLRLNLSEMN